MLIKSASALRNNWKDFRMAFLAKPDLPTKFRGVLTNPVNVVEVQIITVDDPQFWTKESKLPKYQV